MKNKKKLFFIFSSVFLIFIIGIIIFIMNSHQSKTELIKATYSSTTNIGNNNSIRKKTNMLSDAISMDSTSDGLFTVQNNVLNSTDEYVTEEYETGIQGSSESKLLDNKMLRKTYNYRAETTDFTNFNTVLHDKINNLGGYIENENIDSRDINNSTFTETYKVRRLNCIIRVPTDKTGDLLKLMDDGVDVTFKEEYIEDITSDYIDTETHITSLKSEYEVLEDLLTMATSVSEIIEVQDRLTSLNQQIESYEKKLEHLKTDINYSKINLTIEEVIYYEDTVERWTSDVAESWAYIFEDWIESTLLPILLISISLIPILGIVSLIIYILFKAIINYKNKHQQVIVLKQDK